MANGSSHDSISKSYWTVHILIFAFHCIYSSRILCDTGECEKPDYIKHLTKVLSDEKATISDIILTHWHYDHIGGVKDVFQSLDIGNGSVQNSKSFVFIWIQFRSSYIDCSIWKHPRSFNEKDDYPEILNGLQLKPLRNEQIFSTDGVTLKVIHTPGHTTDHCIFFVNETNEVFSGNYSNFDKITSALPWQLKIRNHF